MLYVAFESLGTSPSAATHAGGIMRGLRSLGWEIEEALSRGGRLGEPQPVFRRLARYIKVSAVGVWYMRSAETIYLRAHFAALPLFAFGMLLGKRMVIEVNGQPSDVSITYPFLRPIRHLIQHAVIFQYRKAAHLFPVTSGLAEWLAAVARHGRITVIANGVDPEVFRFRQAPSRRQVVFFGYLARWHGIETMMRATLLPQWPPDVRLLIIGDGPEQRTLTERLREHTRIIYLGPLPQVEIGEHLAGSIAGLVPISNPGNRSATGVIPLKLLEILASGVPAIVTDLPGQAGIVRSEGCGLVVPPDDPEALAKAVLHLATDNGERRRMGGAGAAAVQRSYTWTVLAEKVEAVLLGGRG